MALVYPTMRLEAVPQNMLNETVKEMVLPSFPLRLRLAEVV
jgi:hypothetical protein